MPFRSSQKVDVMRIAIDLTPLLPGGENGGAKIMTLQLVKHLAMLEPNITFLLLSSKKNHSELLPLRAHNIKVVNTSLLHTIDALLHTKKKGFMAFLLKRLQPLLVRMRIRILRQMEANLLFCPFTAPYYHNIVSPVVSVIYDLQSHYLSDHFSLAEKEERKRNFNNACQNANALICISDFVRQTVIENSRFNPQDIKTIYIRLAYRLPSIPANKQQKILDNMGLTANQFLLYPANFWPHKNHKILFAAFSLFCKMYPNTSLKLVCTGHENAAKKQWQEAINALGMQDKILLPGYLSDEAFACYMQGCRALIFPSLYEGFGMPTLEAMAHGKPVLCSNLTSLPEIVGNAAILFNPYHVTDIAHAIHRIVEEPSLLDSLIAYGKERVQAFGTEMDMAKEYLNVFKHVLQKNTLQRN